MGSFTFKTFLNCCVPALPVSSLFCFILIRRWDIFFLFKIFLYISLNTFYYTFKNFCAVGHSQVK